MEEENIYLSEANPLRLTECGRCKALVRREQFELHLAWHERIGDADA